LLIYASKQIATARAIAHDLEVVVGRARHSR
jgi:hypothetical protein